MTELIRTREHSVIKRQRTHHKSPSDEKLETAYEFLSRDQIYQDAMRQGQRGIKDLNIVALTDYRTELTCFISSYPSLILAVRWNDCTV